VREGDDEFDSDEDEAFFAREREIANRAKRAAETAATEPALPPLSTKRPVAVVDVSEDEEEDEVSLARRILSSQEDVDSETDDTPVDVSDSESRKRRKMSVDGDGDGDDEDVDMVSGVEEKENTTVMTRRPRVRGGFVIDSDDDE
jgi:replication fork protection complex subunit Tof1/Swi1